MYGNHSPNCRGYTGGCSNDETFFFSAFYDGREGAVDNSNAKQLKDCKGEEMLHVRRAGAGGNHQRSAECSGVRNAAECGVQRREGGRQGFWREEKISL